MKPKQLANVLIKILGLSEIVRYLAQVTAVLIQMLEAGGRFGGSGYASLWANLVIELTIGIVLIAKSRAIAELLFRTEDEESPET
jgi:hypothetical protein